MSPDDALHKLDQAFRAANNALRKAAPSPHGEATAFIPAEAARLIQSLILRQQETQPITSFHAAAPSPDLRGRGLRFIAVGTQTFAYWPDTPDREWSSQLAHLGSLLLSPPKAEHSDFAWSLFSLSHDLAPQAGLDAKLALVAWGICVHWPETRRRQQARLQRLPAH